MAQQIAEITTLPTNAQVIKILNEVIKRYNSLADIYTFKGSVETYADLLAIQNPNVGDVYNVKQEDTEHGVAAGSNFVWDGTAWDNLGMSMDGLVKKINGFTPDDLGAVIFQYIKNIENDDGTLTVTVRNGEEETQLTIQTGKVKTVNGVEPDNEGNIQITTNEGVWQANEEVEAGDMRYLAGRDNTGYMLEYVGAGTTGTIQPVVDNPIEIANYSAIDRVGKMRMIFNLADKDVDEILAAGVLYNRATYEELWNYVQLKPSLLISEAEWQAKYAQTNGKFVPYYSEGDGTTTFRTPLLSAYPCGVSNSDDIGNYASDGLPNITGVITTNDEAKINVSGAFAIGNSGPARWPIDDNGQSNNVTFDASRSNPIYGNADEVRPKTMYGIWVIKAVGVIVDSIGSTDLQSILNGVEQTQSKVNDLFYIPNETDTLVALGGIGGILSGDRKRLQFTITTPKSMKNITTITVNSLKLNARKYSGGYFVSDGWVEGGTEYLDSSVGTLFNVSKDTNNSITILYDFNEAVTTETNNVPIGIEVSQMNITLV